MVTIKLRNGVDIPMLGYGTLQISSSIATDCITKALKQGYRMIDTAAAYFNEKEIGIALKESKIPRDELFMISKVWIQDTGYENTLKAFSTSLKNLGLDYLDLYLIHQPYGDYYGSWRAMEELYKQGKIRAIGVCNFSISRFVDLCYNCRIQPMVNQIEIHPFFQQEQLLHVLKEYGCIAQAWGPLSEGQCRIFHHDCLAKIAHKHHKTIAQIILRWHIQRRIVAIPKTVHEDRMIENLKVWDFELDEEDLLLIAHLDVGYSEIIDHQSLMTTKRLNMFKIHE